jgi:hypothetical protein
MIGTQGVKFNSPCPHGQRAAGVFKLQAIIVGSDLLIEIVDDASPSDPALWLSAASAVQHGHHGLRMIGELVD